MHTIKFCSVTPGPVITVGSDLIMWFNVCAYAFLAKLHMCVCYKWDGLFIRRKFKFQLIVLEKHAHLQFMINRLSYHYIIVVSLCVSMYGSQGYYGCTTVILLPPGLIMVRGIIKVRYHRLLH